MSAIIAIRQRHAVHVLTDGASWDAAGAEVEGMESPKVWPLPNRNAVIAARGPRLAPALLVEFLGSAPSGYDAMKGRAAELIQAAAQFFHVLWSAAPKGGEFEVVVAGISETSGPDSYVVVSHDRGPGVAPWTVAPCGSVMIMPGDPHIIEAIKRALPADRTSPEHLDPAVDGLAMLRIQREAACDGISVGGFAQLTTVTRDQITTRILSQSLCRPADRPRENIPC